MKPEHEHTIDCVMSRFSYSRDTFSSFHMNCVRNYNHYRMWNTGSYQTHRNNIVVPLIFSMVWADIARKISTSYPSNQIIDVFGYGPEDRPAAEKNRVLLNSQLKDTRMFTKAINVLANGDICGAGIAQLSWKNEERQVTSRDQLVVPISGETIETLRTENVVTFDGPEVRPGDPIDFFPQPGIPDPADLEWVVVRYALDMDTVELLVEKGIFDKSFLKQLQFANEMPRKNRFSDDHVEDYKDMRHNEETGFPGHGRVKTDKYSRSVEFHELWGRMPKELAEEATPEDEEVAVWRVVTIANGSMVARNRPIPYWHGQIPFYIYRPLPDPYFLFGPSKAQIIEKYQWSASRLASQKLDTLDLHGDPMFYSNRYANIERRNLVTAPGRIIEGDAPASEAMMPITPDLRGTQMLYNEVEWLDQQGQKASGIIEDTVAGGMSGQRQTAREFVGRQENISVRLLLEARIAYLAPASVTGLNEGRILLLEAKRRAGALISKILPGAPQQAKSGLGQFDLGFRVGGSGPGLIEFIRVLEDRKEPIRITPVMLRGSTFGPELTLRLTFLSYRPLSVRTPAVWAAVNSRGRGPDFDRVRREYIEGIGTAGDRPFAPPTWVRDPFSKPLPEKK